VRIDYLDTSAWVKQFLRYEPGSQRMDALWNDAPAVATSDLARVEMLSTLARRIGRGQVDLAEYRRVRSSFLAAWDTVRVVPLTPELLERAGYLAEVHFLRGADAIHFASVLPLRPAVRLVAADAELLEAAQAVGVPTVDPSSP